MALPDFTYAPANHAARLQSTLSVLAHTEAALAGWCEDVDLVGLVLREHGLLPSYNPADPPALGEIVVVDCTGADEPAIAALVDIDARAASSRTEVVVVTNADALETAFACFELSRPHILVDPSHGERLVALGQAMSRKPRTRLNELSEEDRLSLIRLTEQVAEIAARLERLGQQGVGADGGAFRFQSPGQSFKGDAGAERALLKRPKPPLPDARLVRKIIQQRQLRARFFDGDLFADPAWDILLDLTAARVERTRVSVTSLCIASGVPPTTALRWISQMVDAGLLERQQDEMDRRRAFIALTDKAAEAMARYFAELGSDVLLAI